MAFRFGILGPTLQPARLREALRFLLVDAESDRVICLCEPNFVRKEIQSWSRELAAIGSADAGEYELSAIAADELAAETPLSVERARDLLHSIKALRRLRSIQVLDEARSKAIEFVGGRCVTMVLDKGLLTEDDVANASLVLYGRSPQPEFRRFGKRCFFSPGPVDAHHVGLLEQHESEATITLFDLDGTPVWKEPVLAGGSRLIVNAAQRERQD